MKFKFWIAIITAAIAAGSGYLLLRPSTLMPTFTLSNILDIPGPNAPDAVKKAHFEAVLNLADEKEYLEINDCKAYPVVYRVQEDASIKFRNNDNGAHRILIDKDHVFDLKASSVTSVKASLGKGPGLYAFGCENPSPATKAAGILLVTPKS